MVSHFKLLGPLAVFCVIQLVLAGALLAQQEFQTQGAAPAPVRRAVKKPIMENVFFNVVWGSILGGLLAGSSAVLATDTPTSPPGARDTVALGATYGGLVGLGVGIWLGFSGATFDPKRSLFFSGIERGPSGSLASRQAPPFVLEFSETGPWRVTGFRARVLNLRF